MGYDGDVFVIANGIVLLICLRSNITVSNKSGDNSSDKPKRRRFHISKSGDTSTQL